VFLSFFSVEGGGLLPIQLSFCVVLFFLFRAAMSQPSAPAEEEEEESEEDEEEEEESEEEESEEEESEEEEWKEEGGWGRGRRCLHVYVNYMCNTVVDRKLA